jgi:putative transposase
MLDIYSRRVIGYLASDNMYAINVVKVLEMAVRLRKQWLFKQLIHHSDKGSQYCANEYIKVLTKANISISMAGNSLENPYAERLNGIIKNDYLVHFNTSSFSKLKKSLTEVVWLYNNERPHSELKNMTPVEYEKIIRQQKESERITMELYDFNKNNK